MRRKRGRGREKKVGEWERRNGSERGRRGKGGFGGRCRKGMLGVS